MVQYTRETLYEEVWNASGESFLPKIQRIC